VEVGILVGKWNIYEAHVFSRSLVQTCWMETTSLCLNTQLRVKIFLHSHYFYWNLGNPLNFMCSPLMTSIIFHTRGHKTQENVSYALIFMFKLMFIFRILRSWKATFFTSLHFALRVMYLSVSGIWKSVFVHRTEI
jgi:hypothetical protein